MSLIKSKKLWPALFLIAIILTLNLSIRDNGQVLADDLEDINFNQFFNYYVFILTSLE